MTYVNKSDQFQTDFTDLFILFFVNGINRPIYRGKSVVNRKVNREQIGSKSANLQGVNRLQIGK